MANTPENSSNGSSAADEPSQELLEEICAKFILFSPKDSLNKEKLFFLVEQAWWHYEDRIRPASSVNLKHYASYTTFAEPLFRKCEALSPLRPNLQAYLEDYRRYKQSIPVYGAILLDAAMEQVLLVRGNKSSMGWGFPRGKVNEGESEPDCAIREVLEETGYDIRSKLVETDYLEATMDGKRHKLYIVTGLDPTTQEFEPHSKWEIGAYAWHRVDALPATSDEASQVYMSADGVRHRFFMIHPFVGRLRKWIEKCRRHQNGRQHAQQHSQQQPQQPHRVPSTTWSQASSAASSFHVNVRELQQTLALNSASSSASAVPAAAPPSPAVAQGQLQARREHKISRIAQQPAANGNGVAAAAAAVAVAAAQRQQEQQKLLQQVQQRLSQLQQQEPQQAGPGADAAGGSMANFRFDKGSIMGCFAAVA